MRGRVFLGVAMVMAVLLAWPLRLGHAFLDDHAFIALARHIDDPSLLLYRDSLGAFFFRPVGMALWWVSVAAFGNFAPAHLALNIAVHTINGALLYLVLRSWRIPTMAAAGVALVFIAHPSTYSTASWLSDRFDLFATSFGLVAIWTLERYLQQRRAALAGCAAIALLASLFSKEIGIAFAAAAFVAVAWRSGTHSGGARERTWLLLAITGVVVLAVGIRPFVLREVTESMFFRDGVIATIAGGTSKWLRNLPAFIVVQHWRGVAVGFWAALLALVVIRAFSSSARKALGSEGVLRTLAVSLSIVVVSAIAQAPIVHASPITPYSFADEITEASVFAPLGESRFYYVSLAGLALALGVVGHAVLQFRSSAAKMFVSVLTVLVLVGFVGTDRYIARRWVAFVEAQDVIIRNAIATLEPARAKPGCKVYLLGTPPISAPFRSLMDPTIKQALPSGHPLIACFIQAEHTPWYHLVANAGLPPNAEKPLETMTLAGKAYPPLRVGNLSYFYLNAADASAIVADPNATFYIYERATFTNVTNEIRTGKRTVNFFTNRPPT